MNTSAIPIAQKPLTIAILGGTGFVGKHLAAQLTTLGHHVKVLTRNIQQHRELWVLPTVQLMEGSPQNYTHLEQFFTEIDVVINLIGILNEKTHDGLGFQQIHVGITDLVVKAAKAMGVKRLLHMSALGAADTPERSHYLRTKGEAEELAHKANSEDFHVTSFRPSIIFGSGDHFFTQFAHLLRMSPWVFLLPCYDSLHAPIYVRDVVDCFIQSLNEKETYGKRYELIGPKIYTLKKLVSYTASLIDKQVWIIGLNDMLSRWQASVFEHVPGKPFSKDNYLTTKQMPQMFNDHFLKTFPINLNDVETIVPTYISKNPYIEPIDYYREK